MGANRRDLPLWKKLGMLRRVLGHLIRWHVVRIPLPRTSLKHFRWACEQYSLRAKCLRCGRWFRCKVEIGSRYWDAEPGNLRRTYLNESFEMRTAGECSLCVNEEPREMQGASL